MNDTAKKLAEFFLAPAPGVAKVLPSSEKIIDADYQDRNLGFITSTTLLLIEAAFRNDPLVSPFTLSASYIGAATNVCVTIGGLIPRDRFGSSLLATAKELPEFLKAFSTYFDDRTKAQGNRLSAAQLKLTEISSHFRSLVHARDFNGLLRLYTVAELGLATNGQATSPPQEPDPSVSSLVAAQFKKASRDIGTTHDFISRYGRPAVIVGQEAILSGLQAEYLRSLEISKALENVTKKLSEILEHPAPQNEATADIISFHEKRLERIRAPRTKFS